MDGHVLRGGMHPAGRRALHRRHRLSVRNAHHRRARRGLRIRGRERLGRLSVRVGRHRSSDGARRANGLDAHHEARRDLHLARNRRRLRDRVEASVVPRRRRRRVAAPLLATRRRTVALVLGAPRVEALVTIREAVFLAADARVVRLVGGRIVLGDGRGVLARALARARVLARCPVSLRLDLRRRRLRRTAMLVAVASSPELGLRISLRELLLVLVERARHFQRGQRVVRNVELVLTRLRARGHDEVAVDLARLRLVIEEARGVVVLRGELSRELVDPLTRGCHRRRILERRRRHLAIAALDGRAVRSGMADAGGDTARRRRRRRGSRRPHRTNRGASGGLSATQGRRPKLRKHSAVRHLRCSFHPGILPRGGGEQGRAASSMLTALFLRG